MKIALALIVKGADNEAVLLDRCLDNLKPHVDGIFITSTYKKGEKPNENVDKIAKLHGATLSHYEWTNDFADARNFNFSQVPKDYDYIMWTDADDMWRGMENLKDTIESRPADAYAFWYMYEFDDYKMPTVVHKKTMIIRNDGCATWKGALHEDLIETRSMDIQFIEGIERMHFTTEERVLSAKGRNVEISLKESEENPNDPRVWWNLGNSYIGAGEYSKARDALMNFVKDSQSDEEKYLTYCRLGMIEDMNSNREEAIKNYWIAIGMRPDYSDAYLQLGYLYFTYRNWDKAEYYLLNGLVKKPPYHSIIVYNPRDYDYNPMSLLAKVYFEKNRPDLALPMLKGCSAIYPDNETLKGYVKEMEAETERLNKVLIIVQKLNKIDDKKKIASELNKIDKDLQSHPAICAIRNKYFVKEESSGKDIAYYCGMTDHAWNPDLFKTKGFGGSEEAVINLSKEWAKQGYNVTVYNNCGDEEMVRDGVTYKPFWAFNAKDKWDKLIIWRHPKLLDYDLNADEIYVDVHDVIPQGEFNEKRIAKINKVFVKTEFHKSLFPNLPEDKVVVIPNGMDFELFNQKVTKDQYLLVNTSSPDRSMDVMPKLFKMIKERVPQARMKWAYGWSVFDDSYSDNTKMMEWRNNLQKEIEESGIKCLGKIPQAECAKLYLEGNVLAYPSEFAEIDCISVKKAQACGAIPVTTDFGAFNESVQYGVKIHSEKTKDTWCKPYQISFGMTDENMQKEWVDAVVKILETPIEDRTEMKAWAHKFEWPLIASKWFN